MSDLTCDVAVIGAGTAGLAAERNARQTGASTLLIDDAFAGTLCATTGCMPSKLLIAAANAAKDVRKAGEMGVNAEPAIDGAAVMARVRSMRDDFAAATKKSFDSLPDGTAIKARARFIDTTRLALDDGRTVSARAIVVATGATPKIPGPFKDLGDRVLTNETVFEQKTLPRSLAVIGAGAVGLELAQAFARLGVETALFDQADTIGHLPDTDVAERMHDALAAELDIHMGVSPEPQAVEDGVRLTWDDGQERTFEKVLVAAGRPPRLDGLDLENSGLELDDHGLPCFDPKTLQCGDAPVFIAGDVNRQAPVLHEASNEGAIAGRNAVAYPAVSNADRTTPFQIIFTDPPIAVIGEAPAEHHVVGCSDFRDQGRAKVEACNEGLVKLYASPPDGVLAGAVMAMPGGDHAAHLIAWAIERKETASALLKMPFYHPTLEEGLKDALRDICAATPVPLPEDRDRGDPPGA